MNDPFWIKLQCKRCKEVYTLEPGFKLSEFCSTCARFLGRRLQELSQYGLNERYALQKEMCTQAPWGNEGKNIGKVMTFLRGKL